MPYIWETGAWPNMGYDARALQCAFEVVTGKAGELAGLRAGLSEQERFETWVNEVSSESVHSFAIEGETLDPLHMTQSLMASLRVRDQAAVSHAYGDHTCGDVAGIMLDARETGRPMTVERLNGWHGRLFRRDPVLRDVGRLRSEEMQVVTVRRFRVHDIHFEAPPPDRLPAGMQALMAWIARTGPGGPDADRFATPGRVAIAHLWFETLHPYQDGNGRLGRALADHVAAQNPVFRQAPFSLSRAIQENKEEYYNALASAQAAAADTAGEIDVTAFVAWFAGAMARGLDLAAGEARFIHRRNRFFERYAGQLNARQEKALRRLFEAGPGRLAQGLSAKPYRRITGASPATATRDLNDLADKGILVSTGRGGRGTAWRLQWVARPGQRQQGGGAGPDPEG